MPLLPNDEAYRCEADGAKAFRDGVGRAFHPWLQTRLANSDPDQEAKIADRIYYWQLGHDKASGRTDSPGD